MKDYKLFYFTNHYSLTASNADRIPSSSPPSALQTGYFFKLNIDFLLPTTQFAFPHSCFIKHNEGKGLSHCTCPLLVLKSI